MTELVGKSSYLDETTRKYEYGGVISDCITGPYNSDYFSILNKSDDFDDFDFFHDRPYSKHSIVGFQIGESQKSPYDIFYKFPILSSKLQSIFQFGVSIQNIAYQTSISASHSRFIHSFDTAINCEFVGRNIGLNRKDLNKLILVGLLHDIATPAFGDIAKFAIPGLSEEVNFKKYLSSIEGLEEFILGISGASLSELHEIVLGNGLLGQILDFCDRFSYTARDFLVIGSKFKSSFVISKFDFYRENAYKIIKNDPFIFDFAHDVGFDGRDIYFKNHEKLINILTIRANLHNFLYYNPFFQVKNHFFSFVLKYLEGKGLISKDELLSGLSKDGSFLDFESINKLLIKSGEHFNVNGIFDYMGFKTSRSIDDVKSKTLQYKSQNEGNISGIIKLPRFDSGTGYSVMTNSGLLPISQAYPHLLKDLNSLASNTSRYLIVFLIPEMRHLFSDEFINFLEGEFNNSLNKYL